MDLIKATPLTQKHIDLNAKMVPFAGYNMPVIYSSIKEEHIGVRNGVGVFDVSHMGEFILKGDKALDLIQKVTSNDASKLSIGDAQYSCLPNHNGGIVDDLLVYKLEEGKYLLVVNASNIDKDWDWISQHNDYDVQMKNISENTGLLAVQGPKAVELLQKLTSVNLSEISYYSFTKGVVADQENILISATGYTGSGGFELYATNDQLPALWDALFEAGKDLGVIPAGLGARDTLRLEMGYCLYGNDINDTTSPIEAGLGWITKTKKEDFNSIEIFKQQRAEGINKKLVGFKLEDKRVPRHDYIIENESGESIGIVTSGTMSPSLDCPIGMGYVPKSLSAEGSTIFINTGRKSLKATVVKTPFYKPS